MQPCRILIVEDEAIVAMDIEERLAAMGYAAVGCTSSGERALMLVEQERPDLVLMDIRLQGDLDGIATAERIRNRFHLPVILLTAFSEDTTLNRAKQAEPYGYILKPFDDRELKSAIEIAIHKHQAEEEIRRLNRLYDVLSQVNQAVVRIRSKQELLTAVCRFVVERGGVDLAWIGWLDRDTSQIKPVAHFGSHVDILQRATCYAGNNPESRDNPGPAICDNRSFVCNECRSRDCFYSASCSPVDFGFESCASFPIRLQGKVCGALILCVGEAGFFRDREIELLEEVALDVSFALDQLEHEKQRKQAEEALRASEERFRQAMEATRDGLWDWNVASGDVYYSPGYFRMLGYEPGDFSNDLGTWLKLVHPEDRQGVLSANEACIRNDAPAVNVEFRMRAADGTWRWIMGRGKATRRDAEGRALQLIGTHVDITGHKQLEEERFQVDTQLRQAQKMEALGTLAGGIAHDFNNILGIIIGFTDLAVLDAGENTAVTSDLQEVLKAAQRAKDLVQQILAFSRLNEQQKKPVQIGLIVKEAMKMLRASLPSTIDIKVNVTSKTVMQADPTQIHQVLMNLCTNAAHAMREEGGELRVSLEDVQLEPQTMPAHTELKPGAYLKLAVEDTGKGIAPHIVERIFDPFFTTKEQGVGTGLGLSVVHGIVQSHGGAIQAHSEPGSGTTFVVLLPAMKRARMAEPVAAAPLPRGRERVLVVDDEPALGHALQQMLERLGYEVDCRTNGIEALELFRAQLTGNPFALVITDMTMPRLTGADLARELLELQPRIPILLCTGFNEKLDAGTAKNLGVYGILMKPIAVRELAGLVRQALDNTSPPAKNPPATA